MRKLSIVLLMAMVLLLCPFISKALADDSVDSGTCGTDLTWVLDREGLLTVSGTGGMDDYVYPINCNFGVISDFDIVHIYPNPDDYFIRKVTFLGSDGKQTGYIPLYTAINIGNPKDPRLEDRLSILGALTNYILTDGDEIVTDDHDDVFNWIKHTHGQNDVGYIALSPAVNPIDIKTNNKGQFTKDSSVAIDTAQADASDYYGTAYKSAGGMRITADTIIFEVQTNSDGSISAKMGNAEDYIDAEFTAKQFGIFAWDNNSITVLYVVDPSFAVDEQISLFYLSGADMEDGSAKAGESEEGVYPPWYQQRTDIKKIMIDNGATRIGNSAFANCVDLSKICIPASVTSIGDDAFWYCRNLKTVYYTGSEDEWKKITIGINNENLLNADIRYNYVENHLSADIETSYFESAGYRYRFLSGSEFAEVLLFVPYGQNTTLKMNAEADELDGMAYEWGYQAYEGDNSWAEEAETMEGTGDTLVVGSITQSGKYCCKLTDRFSNCCYVYFYVYVDNGLSAAPDTEPLATAGYRFVDQGDDDPNGPDQCYQLDIYAPVDSPITLSVLPRAIDESELTYFWTAEYYYYEEDGSCYSEIEEIGDGEDTFELEDGICENVAYYCTVSDQYGNTYKVLFMLYAVTVFEDNGVQVEVTPDSLEEEVEFIAELAEHEDAPEGALVYDMYFENEEGARVQPAGEMTVSIPVPEGMDGEKCKVYYIDEEGQLTDMHAVFSEGFLVFTTTHFSYYAVVEEKGYVVTLEDYSKGVATIIGIEPGGSYSGDTSFTVSCDEACAVLCSTDVENYTRLTGTVVDNGYSFTVDVTQDMTIVVALKGDVNLDGVLKNQDVTMAKAANLGKRKLSTMQEMVADVTGDGVFKNQDITKFKAALLGKTKLSWDL